MYLIIQQGDTRLYVPADLMDPVLNSATVRVRKYVKLPSGTHSYAWAAPDVDATPPVFSVATDAEVNAMLVADRVTDTPE